MEELKNFFDDIRRIRIAVESIANKESVATANLGGVAQEQQKAAAQPTPAPILPTQIPVTPQPVQASVVAAQVPVAPIPVANENFTQEQIAVAMANAASAGKNDLIQKIFTAFNAQCLMQIDESNYNQIAIMLREAGIQV